MGKLPKTITSSSPKDSTSGTLESFGLRTEKAVGLWGV